MSIYKYINKKISIYINVKSEKYVNKKVDVYMSVSIRMHTYVYMDRHIIR